MTTPSSQKKCLPCLSSDNHLLSRRLFTSSDASFSCQCKTFEHMTTVKEYVDWCEGFGKICPGATFTVRFKTFDEATSTAIFICTYHATHTGEGGPVDKPTNKSTDSDYVYMLKFNNEDKVESMHKTWNDSELLGEKKSRTCQR